MVELFLIQAIVVPGPPELQSYKGLGIKGHTGTWIILEARMPISLCSKAAYSALLD